MFKSAAQLGREFRSEVAPILKSKGFGLKIATSRKNYYHDGRITITINKVPTNFPVWVSEYSRWDRTDNADRLISTIKDRINTLISNNNVELDANGEDGLDVDVEVSYGNTVKFIPYEGMDDSD